ncbi:MAG: hypothetical protein ACE14T_03990 [Syntrophales bacterium]
MKSAISVPLGLILAASTCLATEVRPADILYEYGQVVESAGEGRGFIICGNCPRRKAPEKITVTPVVQIRLPLRFTKIYEKETVK